MTTIKLMTSDQILIAAQKVRIAAGDINSVLLHVDFDDSWNAFPNRNASFSNDAVNGGKIEEVLLVGGECIVPPAILSKEGIMYIGLTGYSSDGTARKTSLIVKQKISHSLNNTTTTIEPALDLYMQYLAALNEKLNPITEAVTSQLEAQNKNFNDKIEVLETSVSNSLEAQNIIVQNALNEQAGKSYAKAETDAKIQESYEKSRKNAKADLKSRTRLWAHPCYNSYTNDFLDATRLAAWEDLVFPPSGFVRFEVLFQVDSDDVAEPVYIFCTFRNDAYNIVEDGGNPEVFKYQVQHTMLDSSSVAAFTRTVTIGADFIEFSDCSKIKHGSTSTTTDNYKLVPIAIFGYDF